MGAMTTWDGLGRFGTMQDRAVAITWVGIGVCHLVFYGICERGDCVWKR